jgi:hypothetical protein
VETTCGIESVKRKIKILNYGKAAKVSEVGRNQEMPSPYEYRIPKPLLFCSRK